VRRRRRRRRRKKKKEEEEEELESWKNIYTIKVETIETLSHQD